MKPSLKRCQKCFLLNSAHKLKESTIVALLKSKTVQNVNPSDCVIAQGGLPQDIYCVSEGKINTIERDLEGREQLVSSFTTNHMFPLNVALTDEPTAYDYVSEGRTKVCSFPVKTVREQLLTDPNLSLLFLQNALRRGMDSYERIGILQSKSAAEKVSRTLEQFKDDDGYCRLTRKEISAWTNLTIETVIRTLTSLEKKRRVRKSPEGIQVIA